MLENIKEHLKLLSTFCGVDLDEKATQLESHKDAEHCGDNLVPKIMLNHLNYHVMDDEEALVKLDYSEEFVDLGQLIPGELIGFDADICWNSGKYEWRNPTNVKVFCSLLNTSERYPLPKDKVALIGYVMEVNKEYYLEHDLPFIQRYVDVYDAWCNSLAYKKDFAARQSNAKSSTTNQNRCYLYYTPTQKKEGGHYDEANC